MLELIQSNLLEITVTILTGIVTYIATRVKAKYEEYVNTETKQKIVKTVVNAVEQLYKDLDGAEKLAKAKENIIALLQEKGLCITDLELDMMIEEVVNGFNQGLKKEGK
ncbi:MAG: N-acetylmuramoyl-L-alanine amidase [Clostridia bacterium]|nr:N-acetylmuramoyl-L-alanine amidase [Clostridia bacterium]